MSWIETHKRYLSRDINDLDDVRNVMGYLASIREKETMLDWEFGPVEEKYALLTRYNVEVPKDESDMVTDLMFSWKKLKKEADTITDKLGEQQTQFRKGLIRNVRMFVVDVAQFRTDFEANGPGVPGLPPADANERLLKFKRLFEERERKWEGYVAGEGLFGLPVTQYPELEKTKAELQLLDKLYGLYSTVLATVNEFNEMSWTDVCGFVERPRGKNPTSASWSRSSRSSSSHARRCPRAARLGRLHRAQDIDDFSTLPLGEQLANPALRPRPLEGTRGADGHELNIQSGRSGSRRCRGRHPRQGGRGAGSAVKLIEGKLNTCQRLVNPQLPWRVQARGNIVLNTGATFEMMEVQSQMASLMLASRFVVPFKEFATSGSRSSPTSARSWSGGRPCRRCGSTSKPSSPRLPSSCRRRASAHRQELGQDHVQGQ